MTITTTAAAISTGASVSFAAVAYPIRFTPGHASATPEHVTTSNPATAAHTPATPATQPVTHAAPARMSRARWLLHISVPHTTDRIITA